MLLGPPTKRRTTLLLATFVLVLAYTYGSSLFETSTWNMDPTLSSNVLQLSFSHIPTCEELAAEVQVCDVPSSLTGQPKESLFTVKEEKEGRSSPKRSFKLGEKLKIDIVAHPDARCLVTHSRFSMRLSGESIFDGHEFDPETEGGSSFATSFKSRLGFGEQHRGDIHGSSQSQTGTVSMVAVPQIPGTYRVQVFLKLFNYPNHICDGKAQYSTDRYVDKIITGGDLNITVSDASKSGAPPNSRSPTSSLRLCGVGDYHDMRGQWNLMPKYRETRAKFTPFKDCRVPDYPDVARLTEAAIVQKKRKWIRFLGDSNTRYLFMANPLVPLDEEMQWHWPRNTFPDQDKMRSKCIWGLDPVATQWSRNTRTTRKLCRVGLTDGNPQDDFAVSWEFYTPIHPPLLTEYVETTQTNAYFHNHTIAGLFANMTRPANWNHLTVEELFSDRPDILRVENPDHLWISFGSHANMHSRDNSDEYVDTLETLFKTFERRHKENPTLEVLPNLTIGLITAKTCRKFGDKPITNDLYRICNTVTLEDQNKILVEVLMRRGLLGPGGQSLNSDSPPPGSLASPSPSSVYPNLNILDFWHTTESIEDAMPDKVHFEWGIYNLHATLALASVYGAELVDRSAYQSFDVYNI